MASDEPDTAVIEAAVSDAPRDADGSPADDGNLKKVVQDDIDALFAQARGQTPKPATNPPAAPAKTPPPKPGTGPETVTHDDIAAMFAQAAAPSSSSTAAEPTHSTSEESLNKMVGDEVDKLLADAETQRAAADAVATPARVPAPPIEMASRDAVDEAKLAAEFDALIESAEPKSAPAEEAVAKAGPAAAAPEASVTASNSLDEANLAAQLDDLIAGAQGDSGDAAATTAVAPAEKSVDAGANPEPAKPPAPQLDAAAIEEDRLKTLARELEVDKSELVNSELSSKGLANPQSPAKPPAPKLADGKISPLVRMLMMINSPVEACPDSLRSIMGKAAVVTFVNATGIFVYMAIKKHH